MAFPTFGNENRNEKFIPSFLERDWEASYLWNGREREFPLTPGYVTDKRTESGPSDV